MARVGRARVVVVLLATALLAACGGAEPSVPTVDLQGVAAPSAGPCPLPPGPIALAVSGRANSPAPALSGRVLSIVGKAVTDAPPTGGGPVFTVVGVDGRPESTLGKPFTSDGENEFVVGDHRQAFFTELLVAVDMVRAGDGEVDVLQALNVAARAAPGGIVVLVDSALQTVDPLDFTQPNVLDATAADVVGFLRSKNRLPVLSGVTVLLAGVGDTAEPQQALDEGRRSAVVQLWRAIAEAGGASCVEVIDEPRGGPAPGGVPAVELVPVPPAPSFPEALSGPVVLDDGSVGFVADQAVLEDQPSAAEVLRPFAEWLRADGDRRILLTGTTACAGTADGRLRLSERRAQAIKDVLVDLGAGEDQIDVVGVGSDFPEYQPDRGANGELLPGPAAANRSVRVTVLHPEPTNEPEVGRAAPISCPSRAA